MNARHHGAGSALFSDFASPTTVFPVEATDLSHRLESSKMVSAKKPGTCINYTIVTRNRCIQCIRDLSLYQFAIRSTYSESEFRIALIGFSGDSANRSDLNSRLSQIPNRLGDAESALQMVIHHPFHRISIRADLSVEVGATCS